MVTQIEFGAVFFGLAVVTGVVAAIMHLQSEREESILKATGTIHTISAFGLFSGLLMGEFLFNSEPIEIVWYSLPVIVIAGGLCGGGLVRLYSSSE